MSFAELLREFMSERGLSVTEVARQVPCDKAYVSRLARGRQLPSRQVARRLDHILGCGGALAAAAGPGGSGIASVATATGFGVQALRDALLDYRHLAQPVLTGEVPSLEGLRQEVAGVLAAYQASRYAVVVDRVPALLGWCYLAAGACRGHEGRRAQALLALAYQAVASILPKLGDPALALIAAERGLHAAQLSDNPNVVASLLRSVAYAHQCCGRYDAALGLTETAADFMRARLDLSSPAGLSLYGTAFLAGAVAGARWGDKRSVRDNLRQAADAAGKLGGDGNHFWTAFGPSNVVIHQVATAVDLGDVQAAIRLGTRVRADALPPERRVRHAIDLARAYAACGRPGDALDVLLEAERTAPEQVCGHVTSRQLAAELVRAPRPGPELRAFAGRVGVT